MEQIIMIIFAVFHIFLIKDRISLNLKEHEHMLVVLYYWYH